MSRAKKIIKPVLIIATVLAAALVLELLFMRIEGETLWQRFLFLLLLNLNILGLLGLIYFVLRRFFILALERRKSIHGHRFQTKVVALFVILVSIPLALLFFVASGLGTNYIDRFFTPQFKQPLESSIAMVQGFYDMERARTLQYAEMARAGSILPAQYIITYLHASSDNASLAVKAAFEGRYETEVISLQTGDAIRAAVPLGPADPRGRVLVVQNTMPADITTNINLLINAYEDYVKLEAWKAPIKLNYMLLLGFFTLVIIFASIWVSIKIAGWITKPLRSLAIATEEVSRGNLNVKVTSKSSDEIGILMDSFNQMVITMRTDKESLQRAYQNLENIVKNIQSGVISLSKDSLVLNINAAACKILNITAEQAQDSHYDVLLEHITSEELKTLIKGINLRTFSELEHELWVTITGRKILLKVAITALRDTTGEHMGLLIVLDDLTELIKAQRSMAWQEVARRLAHEIKNPLTPIRLSTERMLKKWQNKDPSFDQIFERSARSIIAQVDSLKRLVNTFSKLGKLPEIILSPAQIGPVINDVATLYKNYRNLRIVVETAEDLPPVELDEEQFKRVIINLFDNAIEAMNKKGTITIQASMDHAMNKFIINVTDDGPGIAEVDKDRLFLPYFSTKKEGTGLGLAIADKIITEHGGSISVRDNMPRGAVFVIELPGKEAVRA